MNYTTLESKLARRGLTLKKGKLNFVGLRTPNSKPNEFDDWFYTCFEAPAISLEWLSSSRRVAGFQALYNELNILDGYSKRLKVDGANGPKTRAALKYYQECYQGAFWTERFEITTTSGIPYLLKPLTRLGTAMLKPGVWKYKRGKHKDQQAFIQAEQVTVYRDNDRDTTSEKTDVTQTGWFGINIHRRRFGLISDLIEKWSAGCQVFRYADEFQRVVDLADAFRGLGLQSTFNYYLIEEK